MNTLIFKLGATGDVVRTTCLLHRLRGQVTWITDAKNTVLLEGLEDRLQCLSWEQRDLAAGVEYDLIINLEDTLEVAQFVKMFRFKQIFGAYTSSDNALLYTDNSRQWFDLSLISTHGRVEADRLKLLNRRTYQDLIFKGLGSDFAGETYLLPKPTETGLVGDVAIAPEAGLVWPMKRWAYYDVLKTKLTAAGLKVNVLGTRPTLLEHLADVQGHGLLVSGDTLPMHLALGSGVRCVSLFTCTSPWEIHDYGIQQKIVSPLLADYFYQRGNDPRATTAISVEEVFTAVMEQLQAADKAGQGCPPVGAVPHAAASHV